MLLKAKGLSGYNIRTIDGYIGKAYEFYFDDKSWHIRYLVVNIGNWLSGREVIIKPNALGQPNQMQREIPVCLTREAIENSPSAESDKPLSRQREDELSKYIDWPIYGIYGEYGIATVTMTERKTKEETNKENKANLHLQNTREVIGYHIQAIDGSIGHIYDFILDDEKWIIKYIVINTRELLPGRKVLISPDRVKNIQWTESKVYVDLSKKTIKESPGFDPSVLIDNKYEESLYDCYKRPKYLA